jgi:hypothetical protein
LNTIDGIVEDLERSTHVSGGSETSTSTTHLAIFKIGDERIILSATTPPMISNGDQIKVAGESKPGEFKAIACRNVTTNWSTPEVGKHNGCLIFILLATNLLPLIFCYVSILFAPILLFWLLVTTFFVYKLHSVGQQHRKARLLVNAT